MSCDVSPQVPVVYHHHSESNVIDVNYDLLAPKHDYYYRKRRRKQALLTSGSGTIQLDIHKVISGSKRTGDR